MCRVLEILLTGSSEMIVNQKKSVLCNSDLKQATAAVLNNFQTCGHIQPFLLICEPQGY
jgi:hypothetical protein